MDSREERIAAYRASIERLTRANAELVLERGRMIWVAVATLIASPIAYVAIGHVVAAFVFVVGGSAFFVGHYVVFMHIHENKLTIKSARQTIASLRENA